MKYTGNKGRFYHEKRGIGYGIFIKILVFAFAIILFYKGIENLSDKTSKEQAKSMEKAIWHGITQCYAIEGRYPQSLEYLKKEYGVQYDSDKFFVDYQVQGENIVPDVTIIEK